MRPYTSAFDVDVLCSLQGALRLYWKPWQSVDLVVVVGDVECASELILPGEINRPFPVEVRIPELGVSDANSLDRFFHSLSVEG